MADVTEDFSSTRDYLSHKLEKYNENGTTGSSERTRSDDKQTFRDLYVYDRLDKSNTSRVSSGPYSQELLAWTNEENGEVEAYRFEESKVNGTAVWANQNSSDVQKTGYANKTDVDGKTVEFKQYNQPGNGAYVNELTRNNVAGFDVYDSKETSTHVDGLTTNREENNFKSKARISERSEETTTNHLPQLPTQADPDITQGYTVVGSEKSSLTGKYTETTKSVVEDKSNGEKYTLNSRTFDEDGVTTWNDNKSRTELRVDNSDADETVTLSATNRVPIEGQGTYDKHTFAESVLQRDANYPDGKWTYAGDSHDKMTSAGSERDEVVKSSTTSFHSVTAVAEGTETRTGSDAARSTITRKPTTKPSGTSTAKPPRMGPLPNGAMRSDRGKKPPDMRTATTGLRRRREPMPTPTSTAAARKWSTCRTPSTPARASKPPTSEPATSPRM